MPLWLFVLFPLGYELGVSLTLVWFLSIPWCPAIFLRSPPPQPHALVESTDIFRMEAYKPAVRSVMKRHKEVTKTVYAIYAGLFRSQSLNERFASFAAQVA